MEDNSNKKSSAPGIQFTAKKQRYETIENGILYSVTPSLLENLKEYYKTHPSVEEWFAQLKPVKKKQVIRLGLPDSIQDYNDANLLNE